MLSAQTTLDIPGGGLGNNRDLQPGTAAPVGGGNLDQQIDANDSRMNALSSQEDIRAGAAATSDTWRYRLHQNHWWYYQPDNSWVFHHGGQWVKYDPKTVAKYSTPDPRAYAASQYRQSYAQSMQQALTQGRMPAAGGPGVPTQSTLRPVQPPTTFQPASPYPSGDVQSLRNPSLYPGANVPAIAPERPPATAIVPTPGNNPSIGTKEQFYENKVNDVPSPAVGPVSDQQ